MVMFEQIQTKIDSA